MAKLVQQTDMRKDLEEYEKVLEEREKLFNFVHFVANDYVELSYEKIQWQRDDFIKRARKILGELDV